METDRIYFDFANVSNLKRGFSLLIQGSEAKIYEGKFLGKPAVLKERFTKRYRHPDLDKTLTAERIKAEIRSLNRCHKLGIKCPAVYFADLLARCIILQKIPNAITVKEYIKLTLQEHGSDGIPLMKPLAYKIGKGIAKIHKSELMHGDLTTSNLLLNREHLQNISNCDDFDVYFIDFGLSKRDILAEDKAVDLYVLERAISSSHPNCELFYDAIMESYVNHFGNGATKVTDKLEEVRQRGRKRTMVG